MGARAPHPGAVHETMRGRRPVATLLGYAHEHGFDLVVIGRHAEHHHAHRPFGGAAERFIEESDVPILVVPERWEAPAG